MVGCLSTVFTHSPIQGLSLPLSSIGSVTRVPRPYRFASSYDHKGILTGSALPLVHPATYSLDLPYSFPGEPAALAVSAWTTDVSFEIRG